MFEIEPNLDINLEEFNKKYINVKEMLDDLINYIDKGESKLSQAIKQYGYESAYELLDFLKLCKKNYTVIILTRALEVYCHQLEDEAFLDLYSRVQDETFDSWLEDSSLTELRKLKKSFQDFNDVYEIFPDVVSLVLEKEKNYHL